jgi:hypothetical protein
MDFLLESDQGSNERSKDYHNVLACLMTPEKMLAWITHTAPCFIIPGSSTFL